MVALSLDHDVTVGSNLTRSGWLAGLPVTRRRLGLLAGAAVAAAGAGTVAAQALPPGASAGVSRGAGLWTSFGTVAVVRAERQPRLGTTAAAAHPGHGALVGTAVEPGNHTWADRVAVEVEIHNGDVVPVLVSPGQLRLQVGADGPTVTPRDFGRDIGVIEAGATELLWVSYLAPADAQELFVVFTDPRQDDLLRFDLPTVVRRPAPMAPAS